MTVRAAAHCCRGCDRLLHVRRRRPGGGPLARGPGVAPRARRSVRVGAALTRLGIIAWHRGDLDGAIAYHLQALSLYEQAGDEGARLKELHFLGEDIPRPRRLRRESTRARGDGGARAIQRAQPPADEHASQPRGSGTGSGGSRHSSGALCRGARVRGRDGPPPRPAHCVAGIACARLQQGDDRAAGRLGGSPRTRSGSSASGCSPPNAGATST